jgi:imidazolonepropionase-like amidohydrolase
MDASDLARQTLQSSSAKALTGLHLAREYLGYGFTTLRDLGSMDRSSQPSTCATPLTLAWSTGRAWWSPVMCSAPRAGTASGFYASRWHLPVSSVGDGAEQPRRLVRREHAYGVDWIKTANAGGYFSAGDDPARTTWFEDEMDAVCSTARLLGLPVAVHTGGAEACKQAIRCGARSLEHAYLIDAEGIEMASRDGVFVVPTMQMTQEDMLALDAGTLPDQAVWKFRRDKDRILETQTLVARSDVRVAFGTDCGMFPFSQGILEFQAMVNAGLTPQRALQAGTSTAAELTRADLGVLRPGACADIVAMPGNPLDDITATASVDFVMHSGKVHRRPARSG